MTRGADVMNLSLAGPVFSVSQLRALQTAFYNDVLPVAAVRQQRADRQPARVPRRRDRRRARAARHRPLGHGDRARRRPHGLLDAQRLRQHRRAGSRRLGLRARRVLDPPRGRAAEWDDPLGCSRLFSQGPCASPMARARASRRPLVSGLAALVWQVQPRLASEQVADVLTRTARQTVGTKKWNERTGAGVVDGAAATALAGRVRPYRAAEARERSPARRQPRGGAHRTRPRPHPRRPRARRGTCATRSSCRATAAGATTWRCEAASRCATSCGSRGRGRTRSPRRRVRPQRATARSSGWAASGRSSLAACACSAWLPRPRPRQARPACAPGSPRGHGAG